MVKGVNRKIIEINNTGNRYFEKALLFVNPGKSDFSQKRLEQEAKEYIFDLSSQVKKTVGLRELCGKKRKKQIALITSSVGLVIIAAIVGMIVF